ncbi:lipocalin/fatty acid-binding family protein [Limosilactobacillus gastricus]|uniref:lipocalin/fatty acid-binding family protein n=1 Tax=Limosilactobacillus gastricus TaxID=227942 RepID=UPI0026F1CE07|nr:lipocalin/fatty acid-binding family protein [Limosilactobacillus gastricus]
MNKKKIMVGIGSVLVMLSLAGCQFGKNQTNNTSSTKSSSSASQVTNSSSNAQNQLVGSYQDDADKAAITLNSDGTGRYVFADPVNADTDDQLTWHQNSDGTYAINLQDADVTSVLTGRLSGQTLTISGDSSWNTETFTKVNGQLDLDKYLSDHHQTAATSTSTKNAINNADEAVALAKAVYGDNNGDWQWVCLSDNNGYLIDNQYYFVKAISKSSLKNGSMTGTAKSIRIYTDGSIKE